MDWSRVTALVIVAAVVLLLLYDLAAYAFGGEAATISRLCLGLSRANPAWGILLAFALGVLFGHLFLAQSPPTTRG